MYTTFFLRAKNHCHQNRFETLIAYELHKTDIDLKTNYLVEFFGNDMSSEQQKRVKNTRRIELKFDSHSRTSLVEFFHFPRMIFQFMSLEKIFIS